GPVLVMNALHQPPRRREIPCQLAEGLVLVVDSRKRRIGRRLTVVVAQVLIATKKPQAIPNRRTAAVSGEVAIPVALVSALSLRKRANDRLTRQAGRLPVVRRIGCEPLAALARDHIDDGTLDVAEL